MSQGLPRAWLFSWHAQAPLFPRVNRIVRVKHRLASEKINAIATKLRIMIFSRPWFPPFPGFDFAVGFEESVSLPDV